MKFTIICHECGKDFLVPRCRVASAKFCSLACAGRFQVKKRGLHNPNLKGNQYRKGKRPINAFTSEQVRAMNDSRRTIVKLICDCCGIEFDRLPHKIRNAKYNYCSVKCRSDHRHAKLRGKNSPFWKPNKSSSRGDNWYAQRQIIVDNQNGDCAHCNKHIGQSLPVHHIIPFREFSSYLEANELTNLIGLCQSCHMKAENRKPR